MQTQTTHLNLNYDHSQVTIPVIHNLDPTYVQSELLEYIQTSLNSLPKALTHNYDPLTYTVNQDPTSATHIIVFKRNFRSPISDPELEQLLLNRIRETFWDDAAYPFDPPQIITSPNTILVQITGYL